MIRALANKFKFSLPPLPTPPPAHEPAHATLLLLAGLITIAMIAHFTIAHPIIAIFALLVAALKFCLLLVHRQTPPKFVMIFLTVLSFAMVLLIYGGWNGQKAGISFLALLSALKFLESRNLRDYSVVCLILYFLAACSFLFYSSIGNIAAIITFTLLVTAVLIKLSNPMPVSLRSSLASSVAIVLKALPLAVLLFFFFPRIQGSFGFLPSQDNENADSELSNSMVAGDFATAAFNNKLAFRVSFDGSVPKSSQLYWRSKVMPIEDNFTWLVAEPGLRDFTSAKRMQQRASLDKGQIKYSILHEKSSDLFLPYLDYVAGYSKGQVLNDYSVFIRYREAANFSYEGSSSSKPLLGVTEPNTNMLLRTLSKPSARTQVLLNQWRQQVSTEAALVNTVFNHFRNQNFRYSLLPPGLDEINPIDDFLFNTRTGYCEHYASVFTTIMRWMGVPARVVVGFQGGKKNDIGDYLEVRYSDAHAWSEVYYNEQWHRVDPTAAAAPERIELGMEALLELWDGVNLQSNSSGRALADFLNPGGIERFYRSVRDNWNNMSYQWNKWIVNYDFQAQQALLKGLGLEARNSLYTLVGLLFASCLLLMLFYFWQLVPKAIKRGEAQQAYLHFVSRFKKLKLLKAPADTPLEFAGKAKQLCPSDKAEIDKITEAYLVLRYKQTGGDINAFKQLVKQFKITKANKPS